MRKIINFKYSYLVLFLIPIIIFSIKNVIVDNDIWFLLTHGRYVWESGIPYVEPFTIHSGFEFVMQQWLSALCFWTIFKFFGAKGLFLFTIFLAMVVTLIFYKLCYLVSQNKNLSIVLTLLFSYMMKNYLVLRPQIFTYLVLLLELFFLEKYIKTRNKKNLIILPFLSFFEINLHASMWFFQFLFILPFFINGINLKKINFDKLKVDKYKLTPLLVVTLIMFLVGFINPYGYKSITYIFGSYGIDVINNFIGEMKELSFRYFECKTILVIIFVIIILFNYLKKNKIDIRHYLLMFGTLILSFMHLKSVPYFLIISLYVIAYFLKGVNINNKVKIKNKYVLSLFNGLKIGTYLIIILCFIMTISSSLNNLKYRNLLKESADILVEESKKEEVILYVGYDYGGYMEFRGLKSYIDTRAEVFLKANNKKEDILHEFFRLEANEDEEVFEEFVKKYKFTHFVVFRDENFDKYLKSHPNKYELLYEQESYEIKDWIVARVYRTIVEE